MTEYKCKRCKDIGIIRWENYHADSIEVVIDPCPHCEAGKRIDESKLPEHEWTYFNHWLSWEERHDPITKRDEHV